MSGWGVIALFLAGMAIGASTFVIVVANTGRDKVAASIVAILALIALYLLADGVVTLITANNPSRQVQAQCASLGGVYDGKQCWYAGKPTNVDDLMERLYGEHGSAD